RLEFEALSPTEIRSVPTFSDFRVSRYRPHAELHLKRTTWEIRRFHIATLIQFFGPTKLTDFSLQQVERYQRVRQMTKITAVEEVRALRLRPEEAAIAVEAKPRWA